MSNAVPDGWSLSTINDTCEVLDSKRIPLNSQARAQRQGPYPYFGANGVQGYIDDFIFEGEHVLLAEDGGYFDEWDSRPISYLVSGKFWVNNHAHILKANNEHETKYVHYILVHKDIQKHINGGTRSKLNQSDMREIEYLTPPLPEQQKIATILSSVDNVIETTRAQIDKLKDLKTGMMQELLAKGIGVEGAPHTAFKDSPVGQIPVGWDVAQIQDIALVVRGASPRPQGDPRFYGGNVPRLMVKDVTRDGKYVTPKIDSLTEAGAKLSRPMPAGTLTIVCSGTVGVPSFLNVNACIHDGFLALKDIATYCDAEFLYYQLLPMQKIFDSSATHGGIFTNLTTEILKEFTIVLPPLSEQKEIAKKLSALDEILKLRAMKLTSQQSTKKALMQDLLTGKVRVNVEEKEKEPVVA
jgi:type I restriction enzyme S subunit